MNIEARIARVKELIAKREELDGELNELLGNGVLRDKRSSKCSLCGEPGHRSTTCPSKQASQTA
jgi:Zinc knuckle